MSTPPIPEPYLVSYAPTGRGCCKTCAKVMEKDSVRLGRKVRSPWHDGFDVQWNHVRCGKFVKNPEEVSFWQGLRWKDMARFLKHFDCVVDENHPKVQGAMRNSEAVWVVADGLIKGGKNAYIPILEESGYTIPRELPTLET
ncbi:MAG: hypothetical protein KVP17_001709 [Porospora cf. gigantea B]|uniref:uncharacterized protein n=1 Tax=Porospora cf. gigantea B TaxID=2853592 RepID=UPI003571C81F|nr:MAG: hypothetical protein KVP17_001709 [Porospora cf. gigantea B]